MKRFIFLLIGCLVLGFRAAPAQITVSVPDPIGLLGVVVLPDSVTQFQTAIGYVDSIRVFFNPVGDGPRICLPVESKKAFFSSEIKDGRLTARYQIRFQFVDSSADLSGRGGNPRVEDFSDGPRISYDPRKYRFNDLEMGPYVAVDGAGNPIARIPLTSRSVPYQDINAR